MVVRLAVLAGVALSLPALRGLVVGDATLGEAGELAFNSQKKRKYYTNPLIGSVHTSSGLSARHFRFLTFRGSESVMLELVVVPIALY